MNFINFLIIALFVGIIGLEIIQFITIQTSPKTAMIRYNNSLYTCHLNRIDLICSQNLTLPISYKNYSIVKLT